MIQPTERDEVKVCSRCGVWIEGQAIGVEMPFECENGVLYWECPHCGFRWHRWPLGTYYRGRAGRYVDFHS